MSPLFVAVEWGFSHVIRPNAPRCPCPSCIPILFASTPMFRADRRAICSPRRQFCHVGRDARWRKNPHRPACSKTPRAVQSWALRQPFRGPQPRPRVIKRRTTLRRSGGQHVETSSSTSPPSSINGDACSTKPVEHRIPSTTPYNITCRTSDGLVRATPAIRSRSSAS